MGLSLMPSALTCVVMKPISSRGEDGFTCSGIRAGRARRLAKTRDTEPCMIAASLSSASGGVLMMMVLCCLADGGSGGSAGAADYVPVGTRMDRHVQRHLLAELHDIQLSTSSSDDSLEGPDAGLTPGGGSQVCESLPEADLDFPHEPVVRVDESACASPELCSAWLCV